MNELIPLMVIIPMTCALLLNLFSKQDKILKYLSIIVAILLPAIPLVSHYGLHFFGGHGPTLNNITGIVLHPAITYSFEPLGKVLIFILGIVAFLVVFNYISNYKKLSGPFLFLIFMGIAAVTALILSDDIFHMYIFFEIAALTQVGIILASNIDQNYEIALKYLILGSIGGPMLLLGIALILGVVGSVNITDIVYVIKHNLVDSSSKVFLMAAGLMLFGWLYTSGLPPFHTIKSAIYSKADPNSAALIQTFTVITMVAIGIAILRIFSYMSFLGMIIIVFSVLAMVLGVTMALIQDDFMRMIGFLAVGELGFIGLGFGIGTEFAITAGIFQAVNEIIITALLFIGFGTVMYLTGISDTKKLGGLLSKHPKTSIMILLGGFAMAGVPPFNGFQSKLLIIRASLNSGYPELAIISILISIVTFMVFVKAFHLIYLKPKPKDLNFIHEKIPNSMIFSITILFIFCFILGLFPHLVVNPISQFVGGLL